MKYAIITDVHGNSPALRAVLNDIAQKDIDHIICLGDMVGIGPDSNEVLEMIISGKNISSVIGNHDLAVIAAFRSNEPPKGHHKEREHHQWLADRIEAQYISFLEQLPRNLTIRQDNNELYFVHYHLNEENYFTPIDKEPSIEKLNEIYMGTDFRVICFGHHHTVHHFKDDKRLYLNPGSLGCNSQPYARYGIIEIDGYYINEDLLEIPYNNTTFLESYERLKVPEREFILKVFHGR